MHQQIVRAADARGARRLAGLTPRQTEILELIAQGYTNAAIATRLVLTEKSVENQINMVYRELGVGRENSRLHPRVSAALWFLEKTQTLATS